MIVIKGICILLILLVFEGLHNSCFSQHHATDTALVHNPSSHGMKGAHRLTFGLGHTHVSEGKVDGKTEWIVMPSWSLDYDYWLTDKWAFGLQTDLLLETFIIENHEEEEIERKHPIAMVPVALYKAGKNLTLFGGIGMEFSKGQNLSTTRLGMEYGFHLPKNWEVAASVLWDGKWNYYNSWSLAFTVSRIWPSLNHP